MTCRKLLQGADLICIMSFVRILVHVVWSTKYREPVLSNEKRQLLFDHIYQNAKSKNIRLLSIGGFVDHVHCLISLNKDDSIARTIQLLKGESSNWANKRNIFPSRLMWAEDYFAVSVSVGAVNSIKNYIANQEAHHSNMSFDDEFESFKIRLALDSLNE